MTPAERGHSVEPPVAEDLEDRAGPRDPEASTSPDAGAEDHELPGSTLEEPEELPAPLPDVASLVAERDEYLSALQRLQADFENYRKRVQRQQEEQAHRAAAGLAHKLLPVLDVLDLAESHLSVSGDDRQSPEGEALVQARSLLVGTLAKEGLERIDQPGAPFDPSVHDAVAHTAVEGEGEGNDAGPVVDEVMRAGYRWRGQTIRPAMVKVKG